MGISTSTTHGVPGSVAAAPRTSAPPAARNVKGSSSSRSAGWWWDGLPAEVHEGAARLAEADADAPADEQLELVARGWCCLPGAAARSTPRGGRPSPARASCSNTTRRFPPSRRANTPRRCRAGASCARCLPGLLPRCTGSWSRPREGGSGGPGPVGPSAAGRVPESPPTCPAASGSGRAVRLRTGRPLPRGGDGSPAPCCSARRAAGQRPRGARKPPPSRSSAPPRRSAFPRRSARRR